MQRGRGEPSLAAYPGWEHQAHVGVCRHAAHVCLLTHGFWPSRLRLAPRGSRSGYWARDTRGHAASNSSKDSVGASMVTRVTRGGAWTGLPSPSGREVGVNINISAWSDDSGREKVFQTEILLFHNHIFRSAIHNTYIHI